MTQVRIAPNTANERVLSSSEITYSRFRKTHTGLSKYRLRVQAGLGLESNILDELWLERDDGTLLFRGQLQKIDEQHRPPETTISGYGVGHKLENSETVFATSNELAHNSIERFWNDETPFSPTVTAPSINNTVSGEIAQSISTTQQFADNTEIEDTDPIAAQNSNIELLQSCVPRDVLDDRTDSNSVGFVDGDEYNSAQALLIGADGAWAEVQVSFPYRIPAENVGIQIRDETNSAEDVSYQWEGQEFDFNSAGSIPLGWSDIGNAVYSGGGGYESAIGQDIQPNTTYTLRIEGNVDGGEYLADVIAVYDNRFNYTFPNPDAATNNGGFLSGPELYPDGYDVAINNESTSWNITNATLSTTFNDTSGNQRIQLRLGDQMYRPNDGTENNTESISTNFGSDVGSVIQGRATLDRYGSRTSDLPTQGYLGQTIGAWSITYDGNDIPVFGTETFEGSDLEVAQQMHQRADMRFTLEHSKTSLPVESYRPEDNVKTLPDLNVINETKRTDYSNFANHITVRGQTEDGNRLSHTVQDDTSVNNLGVIHFDAIDPSLKTLAEIKVKARALLREKLREASEKGEKEITPIDIAPGYGRNSPFGGDDIPIEEVSYRVSNGSINGRLTFDFRVGQLIAEQQGGLRNKGRNNSLGF